MAGTFHSPRVCFVTLGCAKNEVDSDRMKRQAAAAGFVPVNDALEADAIVVNTCSFIEAATEESLETIFELSDIERPSGKRVPLVVAGCMPARYGDELEGELTEAAAFVPCSKEDDIATVLSRVLDTDCSARPTDAGEALPSGEDASYFAYVKISDGCDRFCSFCTIPYIRGRYRSFSFDAIAAEVKRAVASGAKEIVLIAQDTGRWGEDFEEPSTLARLVSSLAETFPTTWFRVMYLQPEGVTDELLDAVSSYENVANYFDIPLQHVQPSLLRAMNRTGSRSEFEALLDRIRNRVRGVSLRTTLIAGFPGESEEDFEALCDFVEEAGFDYVGVFPYSREEGTRAARMDGQIDEDVKRERAQVLRDVADAVCTARVAERTGSTMDVLVLGREEDGQLFGRAMCQAPDVDGVVYLEKGEPGQIVTVTIGDTLLYEMEAE
ncbi:30S ribosomal protein S12 methylthiotransferase RimO [Raoultibacter phocaeensis]|uniref:30S ribosomal protein S12 methylthiotransferase RimO n=1 Tax=Raoultibacter phocaeensis TaxID=2479841 RepID=UPI00111A2170|nr:30S ribosomal protein S12 methylthiotransferase RimO [Raoultibacter phocaeensis]